MPDTRDGRAGAAGRRFSLPAYVALVFAFSWPFQIAAGCFLGNRLAVFSLNGASMLMVGVGTLLAGGYVFRDGFAASGWRIGNARYYIAAGGIVFLCWVAPTLVTVLAGGAVLPERLSLNQGLWLFLSFGLGVPLALGEEFGWRGYLLPRLGMWLSARWAVVVHGAIWWAWHLPFVMAIAAQAGLRSAEQLHLPPPLSAGAAMAVLALASFIPAVLHAVVFAFLWSRSGSLAVAVFYHALFNGVRDSLPTLGVFVPLTGLWANAIVVALGAALLWCADWSVLATGANARRGLARGRDGEDELLQAAGDPAAAVRGRPEA